MRLCKPKVYKNIHVQKSVHLWIKLWILWSINEYHISVMDMMWIKLCKIVDNSDFVWIKCIIFN